MGWVKEKYTKAYALCELDGEPTPYGMRGVEQWKKGTCRPELLSIFKQINFRGKAVLCVGIGRGDEVKYIKTHGAKKVLGIDFSQPIFEIAKKYLSGLNVELICIDFLDFMHTPRNGIYDYVIMADVVEHIPRHELKEAMIFLQPHLHKDGIVIIHTPFYKVDNDVVEEGLKEEARDSSDNYEETQGMHCNRYTRKSLTAFMGECGYKDISTKNLIAFNKRVKV